MWDSKTISKVEKSGIFEFYGSSPLQCDPYPFDVFFDIIIELEFSKV